MWELEQLPHLPYCALYCTVLYNCVRPPFATSNLYDPLYNTYVAIENYYLSISITLSTFNRFNFGAYTRLRASSNTPCSDHIRKEEKLFEHVKRIESKTH